MSQEDGERPPDRIVGLSIDDAADVLVAADETRDRDAVGRALSYVVEDGVVTENGVDEALSHLSKVVSTPETRAELAAIELADAREAAVPVADLDTVQARLDAFEERLDAVESRVAELGAELQTLVAADDPSDAEERYERAVGIQQLTRGANDTQRAADELQVDVEEFQRWLADPERRYDEIGEGLDALDESLTDLAGVVDDVAAGSDGGTAAGSSDGTDAEEDDGARRDGETDPAAAWADAALRHRAVGLLFPDLRAELADLRTMDEGNGVDADVRDRAAEVDARLDDLRERWRAIGDRLDDGARPAWRERYSDRVAGFEEAIDTVEPPIDWGAVQAELDEHRAALGDSE